MPKLCDLQIHINEEIFFANEKIISRYCGTMKKMLNHEKRTCHIKRMSIIEINDFPGGPKGFELILRFCYNHGKINITVSNVLILHCCALYLEMTEEFFNNNLLQQTQSFLDRIYYWTWNEILLSLKSCEFFYTYADSYGLLEKIICALLAKVVQNSDLKVIKSSLSSKAWWFDDLTTLPSKIIDKFFQCIGAYKADNTNLILTRFLLHYLKKVSSKNKIDFVGLAETAAYGVIFIGNKAFSCRGLFGVLRSVSKFEISRNCRREMEKLIGGVLEEATLDDLLVSGHYMGLYYDVTFVVRLIKLFVDINGSDVKKVRKVGRLIDKYLIEISADQNLKISTFLAVTECLPDFARDCFDGVYRAIDIYLECHPMIAFEERSRLCRCLNYNKLSFETCKDLAKNPRIPPRVTMQALISQQKNIPSCELAIDESEIMSPSQIILCCEDNLDNKFLEEKEDMKVNLERMQWRVSELEKLFMEMKVQMSRFTDI